MAILQNQISNKSFRTFGHTVNTKFASSLESIHFPPKDPIHFVLGSAAGMGTAAAMQIRRDPGTFGLIKYGRITFFRDIASSFWQSPEVRMAGGRGLQKRLLDFSGRTDKIARRMKVNLPTLKYKSLANTVGGMIGLYAITGIGLKLASDLQEDGKAKKGLNLGSGLRAGRKTLTTFGAIGGAAAATALFNLGPIGKSVWAVPASIGIGAMGANAGTIGAELLCNYIGWD